MADYATKEDIRNSIKELVPQIIKELVPEMIDSAIEKNNKKIQIMIDRSSDELVGIVSRHSETMQMKELAQDRALARHERQIKELAFQTKSTLI